MRKQTKFLLILVVASFGLSACGVSEARKEPVENRPSPSPEKAETKITPTPEKPSKANDNSAELTAEDVKNGSVKSDDYDTNMNNGNGKKEWCSVEGYVADTDPNGLNVREEGESKSKIIGKIPFNEDGVTVYIIQTNFAGKVKINRAETVEGEVIFDKEGWVSANLLATSTAGYGTKGVKLYEAGKGTKVLTVIPPETVVRIVSCDKNWIRVKYKNYTGWLEPESQCANPVTNCS